MRCFIAIDINKEIRARIRHLQQELGQKISFKKGEIKWVDCSLVHLTLKFLGEVKDQNIYELCQIVKGLAAEHGSFEINVQKLGTFGSVPRVLWIGIDKNEALLTFQKELDRRLSEAGWPGDRKEYSAHLTVCRIKNTNAGRELKTLIKDYSNFDLGPLQVNSICIYKSKLTSDGPEYTLISRSSLK